MQTAKATFVALLVLVVAGCGTTPKEPITERDCQIDAAGGSAEVDAGSVFDARASGRVGGVTVRNVDTCGDRVKAFARTENGGMACVGSDEWCLEAVKNQPITGSAQQLRELFEDDSP